MVGKMTLGRAMNKAQHVSLDPSRGAGLVPAGGLARAGSVGGRSPALLYLARFGTLAAAFLMAVMITCPVSAHTGTTEKDDAGIGARISQPRFAADITRPALTQTVASVNPLRLTAAQVTTGTTPRPATGKPQTPSLKQDRLDAEAQNRRAAADEDGERLTIEDEGRNAATDTGDTSDTGDTGSVPRPATSEADPADLDSPDAARSDGSIVGDENAARPAGYIPPYTEPAAIESQPVFGNTSKTVSWIVVILAIFLFILFFSWFVRRIVSNALDVDDYEGGDLFQSSDERLYRFDDEDDPAYATVSFDNEDEDEDEGDVEVDSRDAQEAYALDEGPEARRPRGFMSWLFSNNLRRSSEDTAFVPTDQDDLRDDYAEIIDVEPEPVGAEGEDEYPDEPAHADFRTGGDSGKAQTGPMTPPKDADDQGAIFLSEDDIKPRPTPAAVQPLKERANQEKAKPEPVILNKPDAEKPDTVREPDKPVYAFGQPAATQWTAPKLQPEARNPSPPAAEAKPGAFALKNSGYAAPKPIPAEKSDPLAEPARSEDFRETLSRLGALEARQGETARSVDRLEKNLDNQTRQVRAEMDSVRKENARHQEAINASLESRFAAISSSVEKGLANTRKLTDEKLAGLEHMGTEEIELKLGKLDEKFNVQGRAIDLNFNRLLQKLDTLTAPAPQMAQLAADSTELKSRLSALQEQASRPAMASTPDDGAILRKLEGAFDRQQKMLETWHGENRTVARNVEALTHRIDRLETEFYTQKQALTNYFEQPTTPLSPVSRSDQSAYEEPSTEASPSPAIASSSLRPTKIDPLGLFDDMDAPATAAPPTAQGSAVISATPYTNGHATHKQDEPQSTAPSATEPLTGPVDHPAPKPEPQITPITFSQDAIDPARRRPPAPVGQPATLPATAPSMPKEAAGNPYQPSSRGERTIRPLTFNFSNFDTSSTDR